MREAPAGIRDQLGIGDRRRGLVGSLSESRRFQVSILEAENSEYRQRARSQRVVVEALRDLERLARVRLCPFPSPSQASHTSEPLVNHRPQRWTCGRLRKRFVKQGDGAIKVFELREKEERFDPRWGSSGAGDEVDSDRPGAGAFACLQVGASRRDRPAMTVLLCKRRRQPERMLAELSGGDGRAAGAGQGRGPLEGSGDLGVRALGRKGKVAGAHNRIVNHLRNESVRALSLVRRSALVHHRR